MNKTIFKIFILEMFLVLVIVNVSALSVECPEEPANPNLIVDYWLEPDIDCVDIRIETDCSPNSPTWLDVVNYCYVQEGEFNQKILLYTLQNGTTKELGGQDLKDIVLDGSKHGENIPQSIGVMWRKELYFKYFPNEKIIIHAKNYAIEDYNLLVQERNQFCLSQSGSIDFDFDDVERKKYDDCIETHNKLIEFENYQNSFNIYYLIFGLILIGWFVKYKVFIKKY